MRAGREHALTAVMAGACAAMLAGTLSGCTSTPAQSKAAGVVSQWPASAGRLLLPSGAVRAEYTSLDTKFVPRSNSLTIREQQRDGPNGVPSVIFATTPGGYTDKDAGPAYRAMVKTVGRQSRGGAPISGAGLVGRGGQFSLVANGVLVDVLSSDLTPAQIRHVAAALRG